MRDRDLRSAAVVGAIVCCGTTALLSGLVGGVALAAIGRFTAVTVIGLSIVVLIAWRLDRQHAGRSTDRPDRSTRVEETSR
jgi:hypothetical protein